MLSTSQNNNILLVLLPSFAKYNEVLEFCENYDFFGYPGKFGPYLLFLARITLWPNGTISWIKPEIPRPIFVEGLAQ